MIPSPAPVRLPPIQAPPHDPTWYRLDARVGWRAAELDKVEARERALQLALLPASRNQLTDPSGSFGGLVPPANVALAGDGSVYLLDRETRRLKRFDPCTCAFEVVPFFGVSANRPRQPGEPRRILDPRELRDPRAMAIHGATLYVADAGTGRLTAWALPEMALRGVWTLPSDPPSRPNPWRPVAVATDRRGRVWVADPANASMHRFDRAGRLERSVGGLGTVRFLAIDCRDRIYAVSDGSDEVAVLDPDGRELEPVTDPEPLRPFFPPLPFTDVPGTVWSVSRRPGPSPPRSPSPNFGRGGGTHAVGGGEGLQSRPKMDPGGHLDLRSLCVPKDSLSGGPSGLFDLSGNPVPASGAAPGPQFEAKGTYWSEPLDSELHRCQWHRVVIHGEVPVGSRLHVATHTAEIRQSLDHIADLPESAWATHLSATQTGEWDGLIRSGPGRFLWLRLSFTGNGAVTPRMRSVRVEFPRITLRRYLPAVWGENPVAADFTDRFLSVFDTILRSVEHQLDTQARLFDPLSAPAEQGRDFLSWLASWIGVGLDRQWPERKRREFLKRAASWFPLRGTREGLWRQLVFFLGMEPETVCCANDQPRTRCLVPERCPAPEKPSCAWEPPPLILEHFQLRRWLFVGAGRLGDQAVLWGQRIVNRSQLLEEGAEEDGAQVGGTQLITTPDPLRDPFSRLRAQVLDLCASRVRTLTGDAPGARKPGRW